MVTGPCGRRCWPPKLAHLQAVSIGAAGTFVIRRPLPRGQLRAEVARRLPFDSEIVICLGREIAALMSRDVFSGHPARPDVVRFLSVLARSPRSTPSIPLSFPATGRWELQIVAREDRFVFGLYRRNMKAIGYLGTLDRVLGVPVTTRSWNTVTAIAEALEREPT